MEFSSLTFLFLFLPIFLLILFILKTLPLSTRLKNSAHNLFLLTGSLVFYAWGAGAFVFLLLISIIGNYLLGLLIDKTDGKSIKKFVFLLALIFNTGLMVYYKYMNFILDNLNLTGVIDPVLLPIGISFFTFQAISYLVDIYRKTVPNDRNPINFALYMSFFPKLLTGPIISYHNLSAQIRERVVTHGDFAYGVKRFIFGLGKKMLIANTVARTADSIFSIPAAHQTAGLAWLGIISYTLQIYFDFSGYTDMAVGIGSMFGFKLPENFNYPYISKSIKEFWTRWHISLAHWLRDYLFLPIAYSVMRQIKQDRLLKIKVENWAYYISAITTFLVCGIWHGANWTFVVWGAFYGALLIVERAGLSKFLRKKIPFMQIFYCQLMVIIAWVFFRSATPGYALNYLKAMFGSGSGDGISYYPALYLDNEIIFFTIIAIVGSFPVFPKLTAGYEHLRNKWDSQPGKSSALSIGYTLVFNVFLTAVLLLSIMTMVAGTYNPFIYFRF